MTMCRSILTLLLATAGFAADITVGTAVARSGQKATGVIQVHAGVDAATNIPVIVVNGAKPGPTLALVAGAHGTEYASIIALEQLAQGANPAGLSGALIIVPLVNVASFAQKVPHLNPTDNKNMNRFFPGSDRLPRRRPRRKSSPLFLLGADRQGLTRRHVAGHGAGIRAGPYHLAEF
jgi:predicted deacylase